MLIMSDLVLSMLRSHFNNYCYNYRLKFNASYVFTTKIMLST